MSDDFVLQKISATKREKLGSIESRHIRRAGRIPAVVYGHGQEPAHVSVDEHDLQDLVKNRERVFEIDLDGKVEETMLRDLQWDTFGTQILHVDLIRINASERVTLEVPVRLRGTSPGATDGGILEQPLHALELDCLAHSIPDYISVKINALEIGDAIHVSDIEVPRGCKIHNDPELVVVHVLAHGAEEAVPAGEEEAEVSEPAEATEE
ncbi:50S ribosomal protein L25 [Gimesia maris]|jgi:large subunit ribosomal protein L25|uniref:Large ribosomal subunit protein bL25 n=1 Tax=Gimesia maris TaxID=122 RepID=A0A3D3QYW9_9PLAN|nr:50S ribosomal protein L25 [Gimesia maris]MAC52191.1 50S ribosomal protein L25 [Gimesia sp.]HAW30157.1 50S ribosomal protein L25 [Planctomycetaceae bacterium]HCO21781.1 50S ribosomal protein L25 [Gimesia maris]|tara:strand:+ start:1259 stop:1885 length:627 start_codon:yes stop_codon:yes gene_type:complete